MKPNWDEYFLEIARAVSARASCPRKKVGCVIVRNEDKRVVACGYNGAESGKDECIDVGCDIVDNSCKRSIHAEINALEYSLIGRVEGITYTLYCTLGPCANCLNAISGYPSINRIVYDESWEDYQRSKNELIK